MKIDYKVSEIGMCLRSCSLGLNAGLETLLVNMDIYRYFFYFFSYHQAVVCHRVLLLCFPQRPCGIVCMLAAHAQRNDTRAFLLISPGPNVLDARISEMGQRYIF